MRHLLLAALLLASGSVQAAGVIYSGSERFTLPQYSDELVGRQANQALTNKTMVGPSIDGDMDQIDGNFTTTGTVTGANAIITGLTATRVPYLNGSKQLTSSAVTPTELGFLSGVTSAIQTQLGTKAPLASPTFTGTVSGVTANFSGSITGANFSGTNTGDVTIGGFGSGPNANGASLSGQAFFLQPADASNPGAVSTTTQSFGGTKTFNGAVGIVASSPGSNALLGIDASSLQTVLSGVNQWGIQSSISCRASATTTCYGVTSAPTTVNSAFTTPVMAGFNAGVLNKGASATVTRAIGYLGTQPTIGANNAFLSDNTSFSGSYFINSTSTSPSILGGQFSVLGSAGTSDQVAISGTTTLSGATQRGLNIQMTGTSAATTAMGGVRVALTTAASTTVASIADFQANAPTIGSSGAVTRFTSFLDTGAFGHFATNNASFADNVAYTGNWFLNSNSGDPSTLGGALTVGGTLTSSVNGTAIDVHPTSGTSAAYVDFNNTGGRSRIGIEGSSGGGILTGSSAYDLSVTSASGRNLGLGVDDGAVVGIRIATSTGNVAVPHALGVTGLGTFSAGLASFGSGASINQIELSDTQAYNASPTVQQSFRGKYNTGGSFATFAYLRATKGNGTDGNQEGSFVVGVNSGGGAVPALSINSSLTASFNGTIAGTDALLSSNTSGPTSPLNIRNQSSGATALANLLFTNDTNSAYIFRNSSGNSSFGGASSLNIGVPTGAVTLMTSDTVRMTIASGGGATIASGTDRLLLDAGWADGGHALRVNYGNSSGDIDQFISLQANGTTNAALGLTMTDANNGGLNFATRGSGALTKRMSISSSGAVTILGGNLTTERTNSGGIVRNLINNLSNTASSDANEFISVAGASGGNPYTLYEVVGFTDWAAGIDNSDTDAYKIASSGSVGTNTALRIARSSEGYSASFTGSVAAGSSTPGLSRFAASGGFSAAIAVNGTWTPTITGANGNGLMMLNNASAGAWALVVVGHVNTVTIIAQSSGTPFVTTDPGASANKDYVTFNSTTGVLTVQNRYTSTRQYAITEMTSF